MFEKTSEDLLTEMLNDVDDSYQKTIGFPTFDYLNAFAKVLAPITAEMNRVAGLTDVNNLTGEELSRFTSQHSIVERREARKAEVILQITCNGDAVIPVGSLFETEDGLQFATTNPWSGSSGVADVPAECLTGGIIGNVPSGSINKIPMTIANVVSVTNTSPAVGGYDAETDESLRARYFAQLQTPATSGNVYHYQQWALEVSGVGGAKVFPLWNGDNTVQVVIVDADKKAPESVLVDEVQEYIDPGITGKGLGVAPIGAYCTVTGATEMAVNVNVQIRRTDAATNEAIEDAITEYLKEIAFKQDYVSVGRIGNAIMNVPGVIDYNNLKLNNQTANITIPDKSVAVLGTVTINAL